MRIKNKLRKFVSNFKSSFKIPPKKKKKTLILMLNILKLWLLAQLFLL